MKKFFLSCVAILLTISPVLIALVWHINNQGWPNDDAADYMKTAYQQYIAFQDGSLFDGLKSLYQIRGGRPTLFPVLATPFLLLFKGNVLAAAGGSLVICFLVCQIYIYAIARRYLDLLRASFVSSFVGSYPIIIFHSTVFFSEMAWLAFFIGFVFHLLESEDFRKPLQATVAGIFLGLAALVRPAETVVIAIFPLGGMITIALLKNVFSVNSAVRVIVFVILSACLPITSIFIKQVDYRLILSIGFIIVLLQLIIKANKEQEPGFFGLNYFAISLVVINLLWWADSMPRLYSWVYDNAFGYMGQTMRKSIYIEAFFTTLKQRFVTYLFPQGFLVAVICLALLLPSTSRDSGSIKRIDMLTMITLGLLLPMLIIYAVIGKIDPSDYRHFFIGMSFLLILLSILSLQNGPLRRVRYIVIALIVVLQLSGLFCIAIRHPFLIKHCVEAMPKTKVDQNENVILRLLELGIPKNSPVAVYTMTLYQARDRIYEPAALSLASLTTGSNFKIIYFWDIGDYYAVIERLRENRVSFLLMDVYEDTENQNRNRPYIQFATALLKKMKEPYINPPGLQRVAAFKINGREQTLFKVLPF